MKEINRELVERYRVKSGAWASKEGDSFGLFFVSIPAKNITLKVLSSPFEDEWQHVSISLPNRCPTWNEMCLVKDLFYGEDATVVQFHPPKSDYVNNHNFCLHLWANTQKEIPRPPSYLVGDKSSGLLV